MGEVYRAKDTRSVSHKTGDIYQLEGF